MTSILNIFCHNRYGRYNTVKLLLEGPEGHLIINAMDGDGNVLFYILISCDSHNFVIFSLLGMSPLHISSENGMF